MTFFRFPKFGKRKNRSERQTAFRRMMQVEGLESRQLMVSDVSIAPLDAIKFEGLNGTNTNFTFTVSRVNDLSSNATVTYSRLPNVPGNGIDFNDFLGSTSNITFLANQTTQILTVTVVGDRDVEADEVFRITLVQVPGGNANIVGSPATGTILNDDTDWVLALPTPNLAEGSVGPSTPFPLTITRVGYVGVAMNINFATAASGVNPANAADFVGGFASGVTNFAIGEVTKTINVAVAADRVIEPNETYDVSISNAPASTDIIVPGPLTQTILNDDIDITLSPTTNSVTEGHTNNPTLVYTLTRSGSGVPVVVNFAVTGQGSNPADGSDFVGGVLPTGSVSFAANEITKTFTLTIQSDRDVEPNEDFRVTVSTADSNVDFINDNTISTIINDDMDFTVVALDAVKAEQTTASSTPYTFTVSRVGLLDAITVDFAVTGTGGSPVDANDFLGSVLPAGTLSFALGEVSKTLTISIKPDRDVEADEGFQVALTATGNADVVGAPAVGTIVNDDTDFALSLSPSSQNEGSDSNSVDYVYTVTRTGALDPMAINFAVTPIGSLPAAASDFVGGVMPSGSLSFATGEVSKSVTVQIVSDRDVETNETFRLTISGAPATTDILSPSSLTSTILNDDVDYTFSPTTLSTVEGQTGAVQVTYTLSRTGVLAPADFNYVVMGSGANPATADDFQFGVFPSGTVNFTSGSGVRQITFRIQSDRIVENDEGYTLVLTPVVADPNADYVNGLSTADTIVNDDVDMGIVATSADKNEGQTGSTPYTFTVSRSGLLDARTTDWAVAGSGANPADAVDFVGGVLPAGQISWAVGQTEQVLTINVQADETPELDETFTLTLSNTGADVDLIPASADGVIRNDEASFSVTAVDVVKLEGNSGAASAIFLITRTGNPVRAFTGAWSVAGSGANPATPVTDVTASGTFSFSANSTTRLVTVGVRGDRTVEADETYTLTISLTGAGAVFGSVADATEEGQIINEDIDLTLTSPVSQLEGTLSTVPYVFTVTRTGDPNQAFTVDYTVSGNGSIPADAADFASPLTGTVSFATGELTKTINVLVNNDRDVEGNEGFRVVLSNPVPNTNVDLAVGTRVGSILNDDADFTLTASSANKNELNTGASNWSFTLARTGYRPAIAGIPFSTVGSGANPADAADFNLGSLPSGTINLATNAGSGVINVSVKGDTTVEFNETFDVSVAIPPEYDLIVGTATGTIINDERAFGIFPVATGGAVEDTGVKVYTIQRFGALTTAASVRYSVVGTGTNPVDAADFGGSLPTNVLVNFAIGVPSINITIDPSTDSTVEADEDFNVVLSSPLPTPATWQLAPSTAAGTILNDDFDISNIGFAVDGAVSVTEGNASTTSFNFTLTRTGVTTNTTVVDFAVIGSGANPANATDFNGGVLPSGSVTFAPGETTKSLSILVNGDLSFENDEEFTVQLSASYPGTILDTPSLSRTILNDDQHQFSISAVNGSSAEGNSGSTAFVFNVSRVDGTGAYVVNYATTGSGSNPTNGLDFSGATSGTVSFADGETSKNVTILVNGDRDVENDETFDVTISGGSAIYVVPSVTATVVSEDFDVAMTSSSVVGFEGTLSAGSFTFTMTRTGSGSEAFTVDYAIAGTGVNPVSAADFVGGLTGTVSFGSGEMTKTFTLNVVNDRDVEQDETFSLSFSNISSANGDLSANSANGQLVNDDADFKILAQATSTKAEGNSGTNAFFFRVERVGYAPAITIPFTVAGTGVNPANSADFVGGLLSGNFTLTVGQTAKTNNQINVQGDTLVEATETFLVNINPGAQYDITVNDALGTITNDD